MKHTNLLISYDENSGSISFNVDQLKSLFANGQLNPSQPEVIPSSNSQVSLIIKNETGSAIQSTGEIRLYVNNHIGINIYLPNAKPAAGALYTFNIGENNFSNKEVYFSINGGDANDSINEYIGSSINDVRFYDQRHYNNIDAGYNIVLDTADSRCAKTIKLGATYVLKITKI